MSKEPFFSIVIPTLNEKKNLPNLLRDIEKQSFEDFDVYVVDGMSGDGTVSEAKKFSKHLPNLTILSSKVRNAGHQRNTGASKARGTYIVFFDADVRIPRNFLEELNKHIQKKESAIVAVWIEPDTKKSLDDLMATTYNLSVLLGKDLTPAAVASNLIIRRDCFNEAGGFDKSLVFAEDRDLLKRLHKLGYKMSVMEKPKVVWSFRRFRKGGYAKTMAKILALNIGATTAGIKFVQKVKYEMGGNAHEKVKDVSLKANRPV